MSNIGFKLILVLILIFNYKFSYSQDSTKPWLEIKETQDQKFGSIIDNYNKLNDKAKEKWVKNWIKFKKEKLIKKYNQNKIIDVISAKDKGKIIKLAETIWLSNFGREIYIARPFNVLLIENKVWYVFGTPVPDLNGGVPNILIRKKDEKILDLYMEK